MTSRRAIISGASIAGLATAFWLQRTGWTITVLERAETFRDGGQNVDVRGVARHVLDEMGLTDAVLDLNTTEEGTVFVDADDRVVGEFPLDDPNGPTAELEILRGDLARSILNALPEQTDIKFGDYITAVREQSGGVEVDLNSGQTLRAELLVVAEGVRSATRDLVFGDQVERRELGVNMAFGAIPRVDGDDRFWRWYTATEGRQAMVRPDNKDTIRAALAFTSTGHVCLVGDAAWCVTPIGGGGSSLALTGSYVLAAYLSQAGSADLRKAFGQYEHWMRPLVDRAQKLPPGVPRIAYPKTAVGVAAQHLAVRAVSAGPLATIINRASHLAETEEPLPDLHPSASTA